MKLWFERGAWASSRGRRVVAEMKPEDVKRVAVIRHAALGDMVLVRPFLVEARKFFPNAEIVLSLVSNYTYGAPTDLVDSVHVLHGSDQKNVSLRERIARAKELGPVDILFDLADTTRSRYLCLLANAKLKIGFPYRWYLRNLLFDAAVPRSDFSFEAVNMLDALMLLGANPRFPLDFGWPSNFFEMKERAEKPNEIIYFPFASVPSKCWPKNMFVELIQKAAKAHPKIEHTILGGIGPSESIDSWVDHFSQNSNVEFCQALPLPETLQRLASARCVVSNDTGIRNLAIALGTPTVGIFFSTVPYRYWPRYGRHETAFNSNGEAPSVDTVLSAINRSISP